MKGIVLAGGSGTRLYPSSLAISKQLLPIYDKPMIYHPISVLMLSGIKEILIITSPKDSKNFKNLLSDGSQFGVKFSYAVQKKPGGIAQAFIIAKEFIGKDSVSLILGDNIFYGHAFSGMLNKTVKQIEDNGGAALYAYKVKDPERFGIIEFNNRKKVISIEEKPLHPKSQYAVTGIYFYDNDVIEYVKELKPSTRGELEITDLNNIYLKHDKLSVEILPRGFSWLDTGTHEALLQASQYIKAIEDNQGIKIACLEEVAYRMGFINNKQLIKLSAKYKDNPYYKYVMNLKID